jgi:hypothetical protein
MKLTHFFFHVLLMKHVKDLGVFHPWHQAKLFMCIDLKLLVPMLYVLLGAPYLFLKDFIVKENLFEEATELTQTEVLPQLLVPQGLGCGL